MTQKNKCIDLDEEKPLEEYKLFLQPLGWNAWFGAGTGGEMGVEPDLFKNH